MRLSRLFQGLSVVVLLFLIAAPTAMAQSGRLVGEVLNRDTGEPMEGAAIVATAPGRPTMEATTDSNGRFGLIGLASGQWTVTATLDGYESNTNPVRVSRGAAGQVQLTLLRIRSAFELLVGDEALQGLDVEQIQNDLKAADASFEARDYDEAIATYNEVLTILPMVTYLHLNIGSAYRGKGEFETALASFEKAAEIANDPITGDRAKAEIARTRLLMGDLEGASGLADVGLNATREDLYNLGEVEFAKGDIDTAQDWYEKAIAADQNWEKPWFKLGLVALNKGDIETAKQHFQKVLDIAPDSTEGSQAQATLSALP